MKPLLPLFAALALLSPQVLFGADFEGVVKMNMTGPRQQTMPMTFSMKSGLTRMDFDAGQGHEGAVIMDPAKQEMTILMPQQQMYMVQPLQGGHPGAPAQGSEENDATVVNTGQHENILGYDATKYLAKTKSGTTEIWITEQLGTFAGLGNAMRGPGGPRGRRGGDGQAWEKAFKGKQAFPLRVVTTSTDGKQNFKMEAAAIDKKSLPDSLFQPPADFKKFDMGMMMQGMGMPGMGRPPRGQATDGE
jgi:hypothetical protein